MKRECAADDCQRVFEPVYELQETQRYCSRQCATRMRVKKYRARHRNKPNGGGPGGGNRLLFSRSELHRRKPAISALKPKPKQDDLFPDQGQAIFATMAVGTNDHGVLVIGRKSRKSPRRVSSTSEAPLAA